MEASGFIAASGARFERRRPSTRARDITIILNNPPGEEYKVRP